MRGQRIFAGNGKIGAMAPRYITTAYLACFSHFSTVPYASSKGDGLGYVKVCTEIIRRRAIRYAVVCDVEG